MEATVSLWYGVSEPPIAYFQIKWTIDWPCFAGKQCYRRVRPGQLSSMLHTCIWENVFFLVLECVEKNCFMWKIFSKPYCALRVFFFWLFYRSKFWVQKQNILAGVRKLFGEFCRLCVPWLSGRFKMLRIQLEFHLNYVFLCAGVSTTSWKCGIYY